MRQPFDRAGDEPTLTEMLADPVVRSVMRRDGLSDADLWQTVRCGRIRLGLERRPVLPFGVAPCPRAASRPPVAGRLHCA